MSWQPVRKASSCPKDEWYIGMSCTRAGGTVANSLRRNVALGERVCAHLAVGVGDRVWLEFGRGEDSGRIRLTVGGRSGNKLGRSGRRRLLRFTWSAADCEGPHPPVRYEVVELVPGAVIAQMEGA